MNKRTPRETMLNGELSRLLNGYEDINADGEEEKQGGIVDVLATISKELIAIEAKKTKPGDKVAARLAAGAKQARDRVAKGIAIHAVAVAYPESVSVETLIEIVDLRWMNAAAEGDSNAQEGSVEDFAEWLRLLGGNTDAGAMTLELEKVLREAADELPEADADELLEHLGLLDDAKNRQPALVRSLLLIATAAMFHIRSQDYLKSLSPSEVSRRDPSKGEWKPPDPLSVCLRDDVPITALIEAWDLILDVDYKPIFDSAQQMLILLEGSTSAKAPLQRVGEKALRIANLIPSPQDDLIGSIFHKVLDTAPYDGSYYTTISAATLLAGLALQSSDRDWADPNKVSRIRVCDPACGSGTLLVATAERIQQLRREANDGKEPAGKLTVARDLLQHCLWGYDINDTAISLAATSLALQSGALDFEQMHLFSTKLGVERDDSGRVTRVRLGSIDLLREDGTLPLGDEHSAAQLKLGNEQETADIAGTPPEMDLVIMNPPYTRANLRHDQFKGDDETEIKATEKELVKSWKMKNPTAPPHAIPLDSGDSFFFPLAAQMTNQVGTVAAVCSQSLGTSPTALGKRQYLAKQFWIESIVFSHDPQRLFFSGSTGLSEMMFVARPHTAENKNKPTRIIKLLRNPATPQEAAEMLKAIRENSKANYEVGEITQDEMLRGDWRATGFCYSWLYDQLLKLIQSSKQLDDFCELGDAAASTSKSFKRVKSAQTRALWDHKANKTVSMATGTDNYIAPKKGEEANAATKWEKRSRLLVVLRQNLPSARLFAVRTETPCLGAAWMTVIVDNEEMEKALCVWFNSTLGVLGWYGSRTNKKMPYPAFAKGDIESFPTPDFTPSQISKLAAAYDKHTADTWLPLHQMPDCPTRDALDKVVAEVFDAFSYEEVVAIRRGLSREPAFSGKRA